MSNVHQNGADPVRVVRELYEAGAAMTLPSGIQARLRPVDPLLLALTGEIPNDLKALVAQMMFEPNATGAIALDPIEQRLHVRTEYLPAVNAVCRAALVSPRIVDGTPGEGEIRLDYLPMLDRVQIYWWVTRGADALRQFRDEQIATLAPAPDGEIPGPETVELVSSPDA